MSGDTHRHIWHLGNFSYVYYRFALEVLCNKFKKKDLVLDAGCGPRICSLSKILGQAHTVGVDISLENIMSSRKEADPEEFTYLLASISDLPFRGCIFNLIICADVLEHITDKRRVIENFAGVLRNEGALIASTSNKMNPIMLFDDWMPRIITKVLINRYAGEGHYQRHRRLTPNSLHNLLRQEAMTIDAYYLFNYPPLRGAIYEYSTTKPPWFSYIWIQFSKIINRKPLYFLRETMVFIARKKCTQTRARAQ